jgi:hypothetical protein
MVWYVDVYTCLPVIPQGLRSMVADLSVNIPASRNSKQTTLNLLFLKPKYLKSVWTPGLCSNSNLSALYRWLIFGDFCFDTTKDFLNDCCNCRTAASSSFALSAACLFAMLMFLVWTLISWRMNPIWSVSARPFNLSAESAAGLISSGI